MTSASKIEWTGHTWNPLAGCSILSPGCTNCYAMRMAHRLAAMGVPHYQGLTKVVNGHPVWTGKLALAPHSIVLEPLRRQKPTVYFVNSMSDLFHENVPDDWIDRVFAVMALTPQHTYQCLTKRSKRMRDYLARDRLPSGAPDWWPSGAAHHRAWIEMARINVDASGCEPPSWPLPNVWLGISAERQKEWDERVEDLGATPAAIRFVSVEPMLDGIDAGNAFDPTVDGTYHPVDWVIVGGESGPGARPMHPDWARSIRDQCQAAGVAFFFKQWGAWWPDSQRTGVPSTNEGHGIRVGKRAAGRLLDGREWNEMPGLATAIQQDRSHPERTDP